MFDKIINTLPLIHHYEICMYSAMLAFGFCGLYQPVKLTYSHYSITVDVHVAL